ncbi:MAG: hypothetical protein HY698_19790 [Deltaproteobacteria bacterium]|nr:hypothetical protein [Deltaproteobacteria bacterium]
MPFLGALRVALLASIAAHALSCSPRGIRKFPDRPVAWHEHDNLNVLKAPPATPWGDLLFTMGLRDFTSRELDRILSLQGRRPAEDVNALDEVPCSTWFCPRNHLSPLSPKEIMEGAPGAGPPVLPLRILAGKDTGTALGFKVEDARGQKYLLKFDPRGYLGMVSGAEMVSSRLFHAAGYNVPSAHLVTLGNHDLVIAPSATYLAHGYDERPLTLGRVYEVFDQVARHPEGRVKAVAITWLDGEVLGPFDMLGRRPGDPNDRIAHEHRRSLRASYVMAAWLNEGDASNFNTLDTLVEEHGRRFVRHYFIDFSSTLGSWTQWPKNPWHGEERAFELIRTARSLVSLGTYERPWQDDQDEWEKAVRRYPSLGWLPADGWDPSSFRTKRKVPAHLRMTPRDAYWGAKLVTSFSDEQIHAAVVTGDYPRETSWELERALRVRRDAIAREWLLPMTALEEPRISQGGRILCFRDLAIERGAITAPEVKYLVTVADDRGKVLSRDAWTPRGSEPCLGTGDQGKGYRVVTIVAKSNGHFAKGARVHYAWRELEKRHVVVGLERDE